MANHKNHVAIRSLGQILRCLWVWWMSTLMSIKPSWWMLFIQELTTELAKDQYCLLSDSLGGDRFPIATVQYLCRASCYCTVWGLKFRLHTNHPCNTQPPIKHGAIFRRVTKCDWQLKGKYSPDTTSPPMMVIDWTYKKTVVRRNHVSWPKTPQVWWWAAHVQNHEVCSACRGQRCFSTSAVVIVLLNKSP